jgi:DNA modification methylase
VVKVSPKSLIVGYGVEPVDTLIPYRRNPRLGNVGAIAKSLETNQLYKPIVVNVGSSTEYPREILAGNHTWAAARSLGWEHIDVVWVDVDDEAAARIVLADNRLADLGSYDDAALLEVLQAAGPDLAGTGYSDKDFAVLLRAMDEPVSLTDPDAAPEPPADPVSRPGDVWWLGPHRLLVGSSTDVDAVRAAAPGEVDAIWTDPPYGVSYVGKTSDKLTIDNDGAADFLPVIEGFLKSAVAVSRPGAPFYLCHADAFRVPVQQLLEASGVRYRQTLLWVKDRMVLSHADYHYRHEPIFEATVGDPVAEPVGYGFLPGGEGRLGRGGPVWYGDNRSTTVFEVARPSASRSHPTIKPVELIERMLRNSVGPGGIVFDGFAGSGSTLIACHRLRAVAFLVELDPLYADVICQRYEEHTGVVPVRNGEPVSFAGGS